MQWAWETSIDQPKFYVAGATAQVRLMMLDRTSLALLVLLDQQRTSTWLNHRPRLGAFKGVSETELVTLHNIRKTTYAWALGTVLNQQRPIFTCKTETDGMTIDGNRV